MFAQPFYAAPDCRTVIVPACEPDVDPGVRAPVASVGNVFQLRLRDTLDFSVDFSPWLAGNGCPVLTGASWAPALKSPKPPNIVGQSFAPTGKCVVILSVPPGGAIGDTYWLDVVAQVGPTVAPTPNDLAIPPRVMTRRVHVIVVNG